MKVSNLMHIVHGFRIAIVATLFVVGVCSCFANENNVAWGSFWPPDMVPHPHIPEQPNNDGITNS